MRCSSSIYQDCDFKALKYYVEGLVRLIIIVVYMVVGAELKIIQCDLRCSMHELCANQTKIKMFPKIKILN